MTAAGPIVVDSISTTIVDLPLSRPHRFAVTTATQQSVVLVQVRTRDGIVGRGEAIVPPGGPWWGGESVEGMKVMIDAYLAPLAVGADASRIGPLRQRMDALVAGNPFAKAGVEAALYDAWARTLALPLYELLGGLFRESIPVTWPIGAAEPDEVVAEAEAKLDAGHPSIKLKMGALDPDVDVARIEKILVALGADADVRIDLNAAWDELTATRLLPRLADAGVALIEQPTPAWDVAALARLTELLRIPVMADESLRTEHDALRLVQQRAGDVFSLKVTKSGGFAVTQRIAAVAQAAGIPCHGGTSIESGLGTLAGLHLFCATPGVTYGSELFGPLVLTGSILAEPLTYRDGELFVPTGPGLGIDVDPDLVERYARS